MKIRMRTIACGPDFKADPGEVVEVSDDLAVELVCNGYAEELPQKPAKPAATVVTMPAGADGQGPVIGTHPGEADVVIPATPKEERRKRR